MKTILVTGGAGFIGSNFVNYIFVKYPEYKLIVLDALTYAGDIENIDPDVRNSDRFEFWYGDINNLDLVSDLAGRSDVVVHFAAETHVARSLYSHRVFFVTDVLGTQSIANAVLKHSGRLERFIHISTSEVYGTAEYEPMDEDHPLNPTSPYAAAKAGADRLVYSYITAHDIPGVIIRPFNNYGPNQHLEKVIPRFITSCILGEPLMIHGDGTAMRDWVYAGDTARAVDLAIHAPLEKIRGEAFNIGTGKPFGVLEIAQKISAEFNMKENFEFMAERYGQVQKHISSTDKANEILGFKASVGFEEGLEKTIQWYRENRNIWEKQMAMRKVPVKARDGAIEWY
ncbi:dTDP-glucose 4,6-dehydratase [bacterium BMS3Abin07]|nr:dTDP-glucose 4,6-dehydratase [bacterium BMS3Abin07]GBE32204.1 dTDP-glucose 4,6-dehydratase [bacterium BMS3Bbin05]